MRGVSGENDSVTAGAQGIPIACSLSASALSERLGEWRALVNSFVSSVDTGGGSLRFVLRDSDEALVAAASLGAREKACCPFFDVAIELEPDRRVLRLSVPSGAEPVLDELLLALRS
jgi:hypothetical protein